MNVAGLICNCDREGQRLVWYYTMCPLPSTLVSLYQCLLIFFIYIFFFFSSRRRHTRFTSDWSSDVCSSDLTKRWSDDDQNTFLTEAGCRTCSLKRSLGVLREVCEAPGTLLEKGACTQYGYQRKAVPEKIGRRRVGKECRSRWSPYH